MKKSFTAKSHGYSATGTVSMDGEEREGYGYCSDAHFLSGCRLLWRSNGLYVVIPPVLYSLGLQPVSWIAARPYLPSNQSKLGVVACHASIKPEGSDWPRLSTVSVTLSDAEATQRHHFTANAYVQVIVNNQEERECRKLILCL